MGQTIVSKQNFKNVIENISSVIGRVLQSPQDSDLLVLWSGTVVDNCYEGALQVRLRFIISWPLNKIILDFLVCWCNHMSLKHRRGRPRRQRWSKGTWNWILSTGWVSVGADSPSEFPKRNKLLLISWFWPWKTLTREPNQQLCVLPQRNCEIINMFC